VQYNLHLRFKIKSRKVLNGVVSKPNRLTEFVIRTYLLEI